MPGTAPQTRLLPHSRASYLDYVATGGYRTLGQSRRQPDAARDALISIELPGLGGAHFPFGVKFRHTLTGPAPRFVVCNTAEDEIGSRKDRTLAELNPHLVLEGALLAATALAADAIYLYLSDNLTQAIESLGAALAELPDETRGATEVITVRAPTAYVAGEASAAVEYISTGQALPRQQPPYPSESGVLGHPTLVSNAETLANLPRIVGSILAGGPPPRYDSLTRLVTVSGDVRSPGVYEVVPADTTFSDLIELSGGIAGGQQLKAIQPGGPSSSYLAAEAAACSLTPGEIRSHGSQPGCLAVRFLGSSRCLVEDIVEVTSFFMREQCGQCPACRMKTQGYARLAEKISSGGGNAQVLEQFSAIDEFADDMPTRCALVDMPTPPVRSATALFKNDFLAHIELGRCPVNTEVSLA
jgi:NADH-quinone oxidoreductase subunit F